MEPDATHLRAIERLQCALEDMLVDRAEDEARTLAAKRASDAAYEAAVRQTQQVNGCLRAIRAAVSAKDAERVVSRLLAALQADTGVVGAATDGFALYGD